MIDINNTLKNLGLTKNEISVYLYLLKARSSKGAAIYESLNLDKSSAYRALNGLIKRKLIYSLGQSRNQSFIPYPIENLKILQKQKEEEIKMAKFDIENFIKNLESYSKKNYKNNNIQLFEGPNAYYSFLEARLKTTGKILREISGIDMFYNFAGSKEKYYEYIKSYVSRRVKKNISVKILQDKFILTDQLDITNPKILKEVRQYQGKLIDKCFLTTIGFYVGFVSPRGNQFWAILIEDKFITQIINAMFEALWQNSEIIY